MAALPNGKTKHLFSFLLGAFLLQFTIGAQWVHQLIASLLAYAIFILFPRSISKLLVPLMIVLYLTLGHLHRQYVNYLGWDLDFTGPHMVLTIKLYSIAWNLWDGEVREKLQRRQERERNRRMAELNYEREKCKQGQERQEHMARRRGGDVAPLCSLRRPAALCSHVCVRVRVCGSTLTPFSPGPRRRQPHREPRHRQVCPLRPPGHALAARVPRVHFLLQQRPCGPVLRVQHLQKRGGRHAVVHEGRQGEGEDSKSGVSRGGQEGLKATSAT